jgi:hypothetical protein
MPYSKFQFPVNIEISITKTPRFQFELENFNNVLLVVTNDTADLNSYDPAQVKFQCFHRDELITEQYYQAAIGDKISVNFPNPVREIITAAAISAAISTGNIDSTAAQKVLDGTAQPSVPVYRVRSQNPALITIPTVEFRQFVCIPTMGNIGVGADQLQQNGNNLGVRGVCGVGFGGGELGVDDGTKRDGVGVYLRNGLVDINYQQEIGHQSAKNFGNSSINNSINKNNNNNRHNNFQNHHNNQNNQRFQLNTQSNSQQHHHQFTPTTNQHHKHNQKHYHPQQCQVIPSNSPNYNNNQQFSPSFPPNFPQNIQNIPAPQNFVPNYPQNGPNSPSSSENYNHYHGYQPTYPNTGQPAYNGTIIQSDPNAPYPPQLPTTFTPINMAIVNRDSPQHGFIQRGGTYYNPNNGQSGVLNQTHGQNGLNNQTPGQIGLNIALVPPYNPDNQHNYNNTVPQYTNNAYNNANYNPTYHKPLKLTHPNNNQNHSQNDHHGNQQNQQQSSQHINSQNDSQNNSHNNYYHNNSQKDSPTISQVNSNNNYTIIPKDIRQNASLTHEYTQNTQNAQNTQNTNYNNNNASNINQNSNFSHTTHHNNTHNTPHSQNYSHNNYQSNKPHNNVNNSNTSNYHTHNNHHNNINSQNAPKHHIERSKKHLSHNFNAYSSSSKPPHGHQSPQKAHHTGQNEYDTFDDDLQDYLTRDQQRHGSKTKSAQNLSKNPLGRKVGSALNPQNDFANAIRIKWITQNGEHTQQGQVYRDNVATLIYPLSQQFRKDPLHVWNFYLFRTNMAVSLLCIDTHLEKYKSPGVFKSRIYKRIYELAMYSQLLADFSQDEKNNDIFEKIQIVPMNLQEAANEIENYPINKIKKKKKQLFDEILSELDDYDDFNIDTHDTMALQSFKTPMRLAFFQPNFHKLLRLGIPDNTPPNLLKVLGLCKSYANHLGINFLVDKLAY